jgi:hypothetical protein
MILHELVVVMPFANYKRGDLISDPEVIAKILDVNSDDHSNKTHVRQTSKIISPKVDVILTSIAEKPYPKMDETPVIKSTTSKMEKKQ